MARRGDHLLAGILIGVIVGVTGGVINAVYGDGECRRKPTGCLIVAVGSGAIVGKLIPRRGVVYRSTDSGTTASSARVRVIPIVTPNTKAVALVFAF